MSAVRPMKRDPSARAGGLPSREMQELWFATRRCDWKSLVVVPASPGRSALPIAQALGEVGGLIRMSPVQVINAEGMDLAMIASVAMDITSDPAGSVWTSNSGGPGGDGAGGRSMHERATIVVIEPVVLNPLVLPLALAADAVLLCIELGETDLAGARHTIELVGRERVIGAVLLR